MNWIRTLFSFLLTAMMLWLVACSHDQQPSAATPETIHNVAIVKVAPASLPDLIDASGTVKAAQTSQLASQTMGNVLSILVHEGDRVQRGQVLAVIDDAQAKAAVERASAATRAAQEEIAAADSDSTLADSTLKRYRVLYEKKSVSPQEFDEIEARQRAASARRDMARASQQQASAALLQANTALEYTRIRAPFDGVVTERKLDSGALASPGLPMFTVEDTRRYRLEVTVNESDVRFVRLGADVPVSVDSLGVSDLKGKVVQILPAADPASRSFLVKIELPSNAQLRSGFFGRAQFPRGERQSLLVPQTAVIERGQLQGVYVVSANRIAELRYVTVGNDSGDRREVLSGLQSGEQVVASPGEIDLNGKRIEAN